VQKNVLLGPAQAGLGWPYVAQARKLALQSMALAGPGRLRLANFNFLWLFPGMGRPRAAQASHGLARLIWYNKGNNDWQMSRPA